MQLSVGLSAAINRQMSGQVHISRAFKCINISWEKKKSYVSFLYINTPWLEN